MTARTEPCTLAVAMIVRNEQDVLIETLQSVQAIADEICLLDTGSTDRTAEIASALGAKVFKATWHDDFAVARNDLLSRIDAQWILWLDAGERLDPATAKALAAFVKETATPDSTYLVRLELPAATPEGLAEQILAPRLVPNRDGLPFVGRLRESQFESFREKEMKFELAPGRIICHPRRHDVARKEKIAERNLRLVDIERKANAGALSPRLLLAAADAYADLGQFEQANDYYLQTIRSSKPKSLETLEGYYGLLSVLDRDPSQLDRQITMGVEALESFPLDAQLLCLVGSCLRRKGCDDLAVRSFRMAAEHGEVVVEAWHIVELASVASVHWALALQLQGKFQEAADVLDRAIEAHPDTPRLTKHRFDVALQLGEEKRATEFLPALYPHLADRSTLEEATTGICLAAKGDAQGALAKLQAAYTEGCREPFALRWLAVTLLSLGQADVAQIVLAEWAKVDPDNAELRAYALALNDEAERDRLIALLPSGFAEAAHVMPAVTTDPAFETTSQTVSAPTSDFETAHDLATMYYRIDPAQDAPQSFTVLPSHETVSTFDTFDADEE